VLDDLNSCNKIQVNFSQLQNDSDLDIYFRTFAIAKKPEGDSDYTGQAPYTIKPFCVSQWRSTPRKTVRQADCP
jgi:hypothetical protein